MQQLIEQWTSQMANLNSYIVGLALVVGVTALIITAIKGFFLDDTKTTGQVIISLFKILALVCVALLADVIITGLAG